MKKLFINIFIILTLFGTGFALYRFVFYNHLTMFNINRMCKGYETAVNKIKKKELDPSNLDNVIKLHQMIYEGTKPFLTPVTETIMEAFEGTDPNDRYSLWLRAVNDELGFDEWTCPAIDEFWGLLYRR